MFFIICNKVLILVIVPTFLCVTSQCCPHKSPLMECLSNWCQAAILMLHSETFYPWKRTTNHPVRAMGTFLIIAAIIIILLQQHCLSGACGPTALWMGTQRENANQHPSFINILVTREQQEPLHFFFLLSSLDAIRNNVDLYFLSWGWGGGKEK